MSSKAVVLTNLEELKGCILSSKKVIFYVAEKSCVFSTDKDAFIYKDSNGTNEGIVELLNNLGFVHDEQTKEKFRRFGAKENEQIWSLNLSL